MKKFWVILSIFFLWACGKEISFKGKEYIYQTATGFQISLGFDAHTNRYFGKGVNKYFGTYDINGNQISFQTPSSTMMMGDSFDMTEEERFFNMLANVKTFELTQQNLTLITKENKRYNLTIKKHTYSKEVNYEK